MNYLFTLIFSLLLLQSITAQGASPVTSLFDSEGFALPESGDLLQFPHDHGSHPAFKSEWWYLTGHCKTPDEQQTFGFQLTFFRAAQKNEDNPTSFDQFHMAHAALFDKKTKKFHHEERLNPEGWNAGAKIGELDVFNENWFLKMADDTSEKMSCRFSINSDRVFQLDLTPLKRKNLFGDNGVSRKGDEPHSKSYYINYSRLQASGDFQIGDKKYQVDGLAWMDHEFSSSQLSSNQIGWNWTSLILNDGTEIMAYVMRRDDGKKDKHSVLTLIKADGSMEKIPSEQFDWVPTRFWKSPRSKGTYPVDHKLEWTDSNGKNQSIRVKALGDDQELDGKLSGFVYWEGACYAYDEKGTRLGQGYTELTGYNSSLQGRF
ncbi:hypothetical protein MLD52_18335 [Puniceicoccaceae bacterium K14]|nr:hypothetical protein [Puniceicoccaceae bacterium K14]